MQKLRACEDCKELYDEAKDQNEFLRQKEEKSKRDKIRRAKKNLVSRNLCKACCECIRRGHLANGKGILGSQEGTN